MRWIELSEPDLMLLKLRADFYAGAHCSATDVLLLLMEVADTPGATAVDAFPGLVVDLNGFLG